MAETAADTLCVPLIKQQANVSEAQPRSLKVAESWKSNVPRREPQGIQTTCTDIYLLSIKNAL